MTLESRMYLSLLKWMHLVDGEPPIAFATYIRGEEAPKYENVDEWRFGIGKEIKW